MLIYRSITAIPTTKDINGEKGFSKLNVALLYLNCLDIVYLRLYTVLISLIPISR